MHGRQDYRCTHGLPKKTTIRSSPTSQTKLSSHCFDGKCRGFFTTKQANLTPQKVPNRTEGKIGPHRTLSAQTMDSKVLAGVVGYSTCANKGIQDYGETSLVPAGSLAHSPLPRAPRMRGVSENFPLFCACPPGPERQGGGMAGCGAMGLRRREREKRNLSTLLSQTQLRTLMPWIPYHSLSLSYYPPHQHCLHQFSLVVLSRSLSQLYLLKFPGMPFLAETFPSHMSFVSPTGRMQRWEVIISKSLRIIFELRSKSHTGRGHFIHDCNRRYYMLNCCKRLHLYFTYSLIWYFETLWYQDKNIFGANHSYIICKPTMLICWKPSGPMCSLVFYVSFWG